MDNIKQEDIEDICFNVSQNIVLPKFKNLSEDEINYKNGSDLVTAADVEAEKELKKNLLKILPSSNFIGRDLLIDLPILSQTCKLSTGLATIPNKEAAMSSLP